MVIIQLARSFLIHYSYIFHLLFKIWTWLHKLNIPEWNLLYMNSAVPNYSVSLYSFCSLLPSSQTLFYDIWLKNYSEQKIYHCEHAPLKLAWLH